MLILFKERKSIGSYLPVMGNGDDECWKSIYLLLD